MSHAPCGLIVHKEREERTDAFQQMAWQSVHLSDVLVVEHHALVRDAVIVESIVGDVAHVMSIQRHHVVQWILEDG